MDGPHRDRLAAAEQQTSDRLRDLQKRLEASNDTLYRHLALYLQVLRDGLLPLVQQACFHLITTPALPAGGALGGSSAPSAASAYASLPEASRAELQEGIRSLVGRCRSLLTVEQLVALATQRQQRDQERRQRSSRAFLEALQQEDADHLQEPDPEEAPIGRMEQSIDLGLELPISADLFTHGLAGLAGFAPLEPSGVQRDAADDDAPPSSPPERTLDAGDPGHSLGDASTPHDQGDLSVAAVHGMEALLALASAGADLMVAISDGIGAEEANSEDRLLPSDPEALLRWWHQLDQALIHRLRTLSHALNGLLVRCGLSRTLLPVPLLDAVINGQLGALPAPANLVRVQIPMPRSGGTAMDHQETVIGVLLRPSDLEFEHPPLRICRQRLEQHRRDVRRMAQHHRDWQRRLQSIQAQMLWENDINRTPNPPDRSA